MWSPSGLSPSDVLNNMLLSYWLARLCVGGVRVLDIALLYSEPITNIFMNG